MPNAAVIGGILVYAGAQVFFQISSPDKTEFSSCVGRWRLSTIRAPRFLPPSAPHVLQLLLFIR
jgi:hypothetical protein